MLSKKNRLSADSIPELAKKGKKLSLDGIRMSYLQVNPETNAVYGFIISKKVEKSAVNRNRIKRLLRAATRELLDSGSLPDKNYQIMYQVFSPELLSKSKDEIKSILVKLSSPLSS